MVKGTSPSRVSHRDEIRAKVDPDIRALWDKIESSAGIAVEVYADTEGKLNPADPGDAMCQVYLDRAEVVLCDVAIAQRQIILHELLHIDRYLVAGVPQLVPANESRHDEGNWQITSEIENTLEHLHVVPGERDFGVDSSARWNEIHRRAWSAYPWPHLQPGLYRRATGLLGWVDVNHLTNDQSIIDLARASLRSEGIIHDAEAFLQRINSCVRHKPSLVSAAVRFLGLPRDQVALVALDPRNKRRVVSEVPRY